MVKRTGKRFGKYTNQTLRYCPSCLRCPRYCYLTSFKTFLTFSLNKNRGWTLLENFEARTKRAAQQLRQHRLFYAGVHYCINIRVSNKPDFLFREKNLVERLSKDDFVKILGENNFKSSVDEDNKSMTFLIKNHHLRWENNSSVLIDCEGGSMKEVLWGGSGDTSWYSPKFRPRISRDTDPILIYERNNKKTGRWCSCPQSKFRQVRNGKILPFV
eukprot:TRINITY_DN7832_c0_g1_i1.p1 TRINITY_DN7832_c0_g1~~TRINITY_DN7832_c0_g1_i1.p1  ORF type:complete len:215 (-),score=8.49 TRINITY_DN7832_c0_g1_i1:79-723(-)